MAFSVTSINELAQHSYSHVIRIDRPSFLQAGNCRIKSLYNDGKKKYLMSTEINSLLIVACA
jgi:hypothetical protein